MPTRGSAACGSASAPLRPARRRTAATHASLRRCARLVVCIGTAVQNSLIYRLCLAVWRHRRARDRGRLRRPGAPLRRHARPAAHLSGDVPAARLFYPSGCECGLSALIHRLRLG
ncbi:MAG: hypothetical protein ACLR4Z_15920 [Butyricicoccaceae bacterium]